MYEFKFGIYDSTLLRQVVDLFATAFYWTRKFSTEYLKWQYLDNPNGEVVSFNAFMEDGSLVAHYAAIPIVMVLNGKKEKGLLSVNTATHPEHQGNYLFTQLADRTYNYAKEKGFRFVIGVANANSTGGFLNQLGFYLISPLEFKIGMGDIFRGDIHEGMNRLYYDKEILDWRLKCPGFKYSAAGDTIHSNRPEPLFHTSVAKMPSFTSADELGLRKTRDFFNIYIGLGANIRNGLYLDLPKFVKRSPFNLIFKDLTDGELPIITKENIFFQLLDFDVA